jgi:hypothetical protein
MTWPKQRRRTTRGKEIGRHRRASAVTTPDAENPLFPAGDSCRRKGTMTDHSSIQAANPQIEKNNV